MNYLKTFAMLLGSRYTTSTDEEISVSVNGHLIGSSYHTLTWEQQINLLSKYVNQDSLKQYYNAYVLPIFDFCCVIWGNTTADNQTRLVKLQKRAARLILQGDILTPSE